MTDSTSTTAAAPSFFQSLETKLATDWSKIIAFLEGAESHAGQFLADVANGIEIGIERIMSIGQYVDGNLGTIKAGIAATQTLADTVAPNNTMVSQIFNTLNTGVTEVAQLSQVLQGGSAANDPQIVQKAADAINATKSLQAILAQAGATISAITANSPTATQSVTPSSPSPTA